MAEKTQKSDDTQELIPEAKDNPPNRTKPPGNPATKGKPLEDPLLAFIAEKEKALQQTITDRTIALLRREQSKNKDLKIEEIWRRIYG